MNLLKCKADGSFVKSIVLLAVYWACLVFDPTREYLIGLSPFALEETIDLNIYLYTVPICLAVVFFGREILESFTYFRSNFLRKMLGLLLAFTVTVIGNGIVYLFIPENVIVENQAVFQEVNAHISLLTSLLIFGIFGPYLEETVFRHIMIGKFARYTKINIYILALISLLCFDLMHVHSVYDFFIYLPVSAVFTAGYLISKRHTSYMLVFHFINNIILILIS